MEKKLVEIRYIEEYLNSFYLDFNKQIKNKKIIFENQRLKILKLRTVLKLLKNIEKHYQILKEIDFKK